MRRGRKIPPEIQWAVIRLSRILSDDQIAMGLVSRFRAYGDVSYEHDKPPEDNRNASGCIRDVETHFLYYLCADKVD